MGGETPLSLLFLWHQHQPYYKDSLSGLYELPWVRLHAIKDYYDMVAILDDFPAIRLNINLVPSLLIQLDDYASGKVQDRVMTVTLRRATELSFEDRIFILQNFFMANWERMIDPYPRYRELLEKRGRNTNDSEYPRILQYFSEQDWRDLQVWFNLAWFDPYWKEKDVFIRNLFKKGRGFTEKDKTEIIQLQRKICGMVGPKHRELQEKGQIEITATPFYHPILPLLCDTDIARTAMPEAQLPNRFSHPEDARAQIQRAMDDHTQRFGQAPRGMWPSEGSVSPQVAAMMADCGLKWAATDEAILNLSKKAEDRGQDDLYEPYRWQGEGKELSFFFRNHELSDAIGFVYPRWNSVDAAQDFIKRLHTIRERLKTSPNPPPFPVVSIILDGENCWEYYEEDGRIFLTELYKRISEDPLLRTVLGSDFLREHPPQRSLNDLWPGSWINANYAIWIGHAEDNRAWEFLQRTRRFLTQSVDTHPELSGTPQVAEAWEEIYIAEGSDWCWWYGNDHSSANDATFDYLFRKHLMNVYTLLGASIPEDLRIAIKVARKSGQITVPVNFIKPTLDGRVTNYFEWHDAGSYTPDLGSAGTMHRAETLVQTIYFGSDETDSLYFRIDLTKPLAQTGALTIQLIIIDSPKIDLQIHYTPGEPDLKLSDHVVIGKAGKVFEFAIPLSRLHRADKSPIPCRFLLLDNKTELERWPKDEAILIPFPSEDTYSDNWGL